MSGRPSTPFDLQQLSASLPSVPSWDSAPLTKAENTSQDTYDLVLEADALQEKRLRQLLALQARLSTITKEEWIELVKGWSLFDEYVSSLARTHTRVLFLMDRLRKEAARAEIDLSKSMKSVTEQYVDETVRVVSPIFRSISATLEFYRPLWSADFGRSYVLENGLGEYVRLSNI
jgi:hypothetical protein